MQKLPNPLAFVDIETTGIRLSKDRIIEIGIVRVENNTVVAKYQTLLNPYLYLPPTIQMLTGITADMLENAPTFSDIKNQIKELLDGCIIVAHNARFDYGFIKREFKNCQMAFTAKQLCTVRLSRYLFPKQPRHNLDSIIERFNIPCAKRHRAFDDAQVLWEFFQKLQTQLNPDVFLQACNHALKRPSLPLNLSESLLDALPECPGVYIFYGKEAAPLYVGKSINIKERVLSHFSQNHLSSTEMKISQQIVHIESIPHNGELGALLAESALIKKLQPLYNRRLRHCSKVLALQQTTNEQGYYTITTTPITQITPEYLPTLIVLCKSKKQATNYLLALAKEYELCQKLLGVEHTTTACFGYRLGSCKGACQGKEAAVGYNMRFIEATVKMKIKPWPFAGPIAITEEHVYTGKKDVFLIDQWCYLGKITSDDMDSLDETREEAIFDMDVYKILQQYMRSPKYRQNISVLQSERAHVSLYPTSAH